MSTAMNVPANHVITLFVDAFTADWARYTVQFDIENIGPITLVLHVRDAPVLASSPGAVKQEETEEIVIKEENDTNIKSSNQVICTTAHPSIILGRRFVPGARIQGSVPPIHTYSVRHAEEDDFERRGAKLRSLSKENQPIVKRRKL